MGTLLTFIVAFCLGVYICEGSDQFQCYDFTPEDQDEANDACTDSIRDVCEGYGHEFSFGNFSGEKSRCHGCFCCQDKGCYPTTPKEYNGTYNYAFGNILCQRWDSQYPHKHDRNNPADFPDETLYDAHNYCRDPDGEGFPWCYTTNPNRRFRKCDIPNCDELAQRNSAPEDCYAYTADDLASGLSREEMCLSYPQHVYTGGDNKQFPGCGNCDCCQVKGCYGEKVSMYNGTWSHTKSGRTCQRWDSNSPHKHRYHSYEMFPMDGDDSKAHNYCRDPSGEGTLWCYTTDTSDRWEKCDIPQDLNCDLSDSMELLGRPLQVSSPSFSVYLGEVNDTASATNTTALTFQEILLQGAESYQESTGVFKAPVDGVYLLTWSAYAKEGETLDLVLVIVWDGQPLKYTAAGSDVSSGVLGSQGVNTVITHLKSGTEAYIESQSGTEATGVNIDNSTYHLTAFSGVLLYSDLATTPKAAFSVFLEGNDTADSAGSVALLFNNIILNDGDGYCADTGYFTAPYDGVYLLTFVAVTVGTGECDVSIVIDGSEYTSGVMEGMTAGETVQAGNTLVVRLTNGTSVWLETQSCDTIDSTSRRTAFSGALLYV